MDLKFSNLCVEDQGPQCGEYTIPSVTGTVTVCCDTQGVYLKKVNYSDFYGSLVLLTLNVDDEKMLHHDQYLICKMLFGSVSEI